MKYYLWISCNVLGIHHVVRAVSEVEQTALVEKYFYQLWRELLDEGVTDPDTGIHYDAEVCMHNKARCIIRLDA